jgi:rhodanese-related sulfurtransferase
MSIPRITPEQARALLDRGATMIDIRDKDEFARERIPHARNIPLAGIGEARLSAQGASALIFQCRSGARTGANAAKLGAASGCDAYILEGGLEAWKRANLPVEIDRRQPLEIMRQVQITAGLLVLTGVVLGAIVSPAFYVVAGLVGGGLTFSGVTGSCAMAALLRRMPWNGGV